MTTKKAKTIKQRAAGIIPPTTPAPDSREALAVHIAAIMAHPLTPARLFNRKEFPVSLLRGCRDGIPKGTMFPLVKGGVNTPTAKSACGALATPPKIYLLAVCFLAGFFPLVNLSTSPG